MGQVKWTYAALSQVEEIGAYILKTSPNQAWKMIERLMSYPDKLVDQPRLGWRVTELEHDELREIREVLVKPYRLIYEICQEEIYILAVVHGKQDLTKFFETN